MDLKVRATDDPLEVFERLVLRVWLENSPSLRKAYRRKAQRPLVEAAVRQAVFDARARETELQARGIPIDQAMEVTRPAMWAPPQWPSDKRRH